MLQNQTKEEKRHRRVSEEQLRTTKCYKCIHCKDEDDMRKMSFMKLLAGGEVKNERIGVWTLIMRIQAAAPPSITATVSGIDRMKTGARKINGWKPGIM